MDKDISNAVCITGHKVCGIGLKCDIAAIGADGGVIAMMVSLNTGTIHTYPSSYSCLPVMDKDVIATVCITGHKVCGIGLKCDIAAICADGGVIAITVPLDTGAFHTHPRRYAGAG